MHYQHYMKCLVCSMHYTIYTYDDKWLETHNPTCPECGEKDTSWPLRKVESDQQISQAVFGMPEELPSGSMETVEDYDYASWPPGRLREEED